MLSETFLDNNCLGSDCFAQKPSYQPDELKWPLDRRVDSVMCSFLESRNELIWTDELGDYGPDRSHC